LHTPRAVLRPDSHVGNRGIRLSAIAARTRAVRLGTCCLSTFPLRDPIFLAAQWAALDQISHGRAILGACIGGALPREKADAEFAAFKVKLGERAPRLEEGYYSPAMTREYIANWLAYGPPEGRRAKRAGVG
jgi:alkanesulfonate monooxygenase SsuD/methylene tetrahydromethanopterin reductase-like flavin-dependent oxidoreductase (luciferase family)